MVRRVGLWLLWIGFIVYSLFLAPPIQADIMRLRLWLAGNWTFPNPVVVAIFSLIGMWILIDSCVLFADGKMQSIPVWPFITASLGTGVIGLIPYLALRQSNSTFSGSKDAWLRFFDSNRTGWLISISTLFFIGYGLAAGDWQGFACLWHTSRFVHVMSLALCVFCLLFPTVLRDDMARRGLESDRLFWAVALVPLFGPLVYLCTRPSIPESEST
ncbi:hypothetical protein IQ268_06750 [Oculatella sp. LEGE 06141]|uniref:hypothetical protein n=1 Tax=Oculatella sp. LEGE 06141 TaxID=1828648 RepID=UPI001881574D|nr:hypothetical protein [Oculatella sp. LEGE 06141]MBE9178284.1 hypothetical protein [Oculatella sp. LEGE 06141]